MNLYIFENSIGYPITHALVIAENKEKSKEILLDRYKYEPDEFNERWELLGEYEIKEGFITELQGE